MAVTTLCFIAACGSDSADKNDADDCAGCLRSCSSVCAGDVGCLNYVDCTRNCEWEDEHCFDACRVRFLTDFQGTVDNCQQVACNDTCTTPVAQGDFCGAIARMCEDAASCREFGGVQVAVGEEVSFYQTVDECVSDRIAGCEQSQLPQVCIDQINSEQDFCDAEIYRIPQACVPAPVDEPNDQGNDPVPFCDMVSQLCTNASLCAGGGAFELVFADGAVQPVGGIEECVIGLVAGRDCDRSVANDDCAHEVNANVGLCTGGQYTIPVSCQ